MTLLDFAALCVWTAVVLAFGAYIGRDEMLRDFGVSWRDYLKMKGYL